MIELKSICFENIEVDEIGYWVKFTRSKQRSRLEESEVLIPRRQPYWIQCSVDSVRRPIDYDPASVIDAYLEAVMQDLKCTAEDLKGPFFKGSHGKNGRCFTRTNIGKNTLAQVGIEAAKELGLRNPATFTGHCWRRSAGTNASDAGANVTSLMAMMGWSCPKTAMQYVKRSRITSLQMSLHLTNVQRRDVLDPFPSGSVRSRRTLKFREEAGSVEEVRTDLQGNRREEAGSVEEVRTDVQGN
jgi:integrase